MRRKIMFSKFLSLALIGGLVSGIAFIMSPTISIAGICGACLCGIIARIYQATEQHEELKELLSGQSAQDR
jgi:ABC-type transport system involved in multi-copper enzyme maturation permease subunit